MLLAEKKKQKAKRYISGKTQNRAGREKKIYILACIFIKYLWKDIHKNQHYWLAVGRDHWVARDKNRSRFLLLTLWYFLT